MRSFSQSMTYETAKSLCSWNVTRKRRPTINGLRHSVESTPGRFSGHPFSSTVGELTSSTGDAHFATKRGAMITARGWESETTTTAAAVPEEAPVEEEASTLTAH